MSKKIGWQRAVLYLVAIVYIALWVITLYPVFFPDPKDGAPIPITILVLVPLGIWGYSIWLKKLKSLR
jgi:hypothetical protein